MNPKPDTAVSPLTSPTLNTFTRRTFMKTSALTVGAVTLLSQGKALAEEGGGSSSSTTTVYTLECRSDPLSGKSNESQKRLELGSPATFRSSDDTPIDPLWLGDTTNSSLFLSLWATGPIVGARNSSFVTESNVWGYLKIDGNVICYVTSLTEEQISDPFTPEGQVFQNFPHDRILHIEKRRASIACDMGSGDITYNPVSGISSDDDQVGTAIGQTSASMTALAAFKSRAKLTTDFRSAFTAEGELSASAKGLLGISTSISVDINSLEDYEVTPTSMKWEIWRIATTWQGGQIVSVQETQLDTPAAQDDQQNP